MKKRIKIIRAALSAALFVVVLMGLNNVVASMKRLRRASKFESEIAKADFAISMFYQSPGKMKDKKARRKLIKNQKQQLRVFRAASKTTPYSYAGVKFYSVNIAKRQDLADVAKQNGAMPSVDLPTFVLFRGGRRLTSRRGSLSKGEITGFIDEYLKKEIDEKVKIREREQARRESRARESWYRRPYYYGGWGYPYRYHYGPRWGWGIGWRGGWHGGGWRGGRRGCRRCR